MGPNALSSNLMTTEERLVEICEILALGLRRLMAHQSSQCCRLAGESSLASSANQSGHAEALKVRREAA